MNDILKYSEDGKTVLGIKELESLVIPEGITSIGDFAFSICGKLEHISFPQSLIHIGSSAFCGCASLKQITLPTNLSTLDGNVFSHCTCLEDISVENGNEHFSSEEGVLFNKTRDTLCVVPLGKKLTKYDVPKEVICIGEQAFYQQYKLEQVNLPEKLTTIGEYSFYLCTSLQNIIIPDSVTNIERSAFSGCMELKEVVISEKIQYLGKDVFSTCDSLMSIVIKAIDPSKIKLLVSTFRNNHYKKATLCVPTESLDLYKQHKVFGKFKNITSF